MIFNKKPLVISKKNTTLCSFIFTPDELENLFKQGYRCIAINNAKINLSNGLSHLIEQTEKSIVLPEENEDKFTQSQTRENLLFLANSWLREFKNFESTPSAEL